MAEALRAGRARRLFLDQDRAAHDRLQELAALALVAGVPVQRVDTATLDALSGNARHQGAVAEVRPFTYLSLHALLAAERAEPPFFLLLDHVEDPQNLGAILRTADAAGVHGVILPERRAAAVTPAVARASAGGVDYVDVAQVPNLARAIDQLKQAGVWVYGLDAAGDQPYDEADYSRAVALVAGAEGKGLSRLVREHCDLLIRIPIVGHVESLNVSVATALAVFAARRQRQRSQASVP